MNDSSSKQFGLMVAYLLPGFIGLAGLAPFVPVLARWLQLDAQAQAGVGPPLYAVLAATTIGMIASCFRWLIIDHIHRWTGVLPPKWDDTQLVHRLAAFDYLVESHYRYYQFVSNTFIALLAAYAVNRWMHTTPILGAGTDIILLVVCAALFAASRDALKKYYTRTGRLIGRIAEKGSEMYGYNGNDHAPPSDVPATQHIKSKPVGKPTPAPRPERDKPDSTK